MFVCEVGKTTIYSVAFTADGQSMLVGTKDGRAMLVSPFGQSKTLFNAQLLREGEPPAVNAVRAHPTRNAIAIAGATGWLLVDKDDSENVHLTLPPTRSPATVIEFFDDVTVAVGLGDRIRESAGGFELWSFDGKPKRREPHFAEPKGVRSISIHAASHSVAWSTGHQKITVWDPAKQDPQPIPLKHTAATIAFHPDGTRLAVAQQWGAKIIDLAKRHEVATLAGHTGRVTCLAYRPDGRVLATGSWDATVRLWDVATGSAIGSLSAPVGRVFSLCYAPDGLRLAAAGDAGNVVLWDVD